MSQKKQMGDLGPEEEQALLESEVRFRTFVMASSDVVYRMSPDWKEMRYLKGKDFLADTEDPNPRWIEKYILEEDRTRVLETIEKAIRDKSIFELEHRVIQTDGTVGWTHSRAVPVLNERGEIVDWFGTAKDITFRKRAEEDVHRSEERLRLIIEGAKGFAIFTTDAEGVINSWNGGAEEVFGWSEAEILGQEVAVTFTPEDRAAGAPQKELATAREKGIAPDVRWHLRKDGSRVFIHGEVRPLRDDQLHGFFKIGRDVTAQRQAEDALREHQKQLQVLNETLAEQVQEKTEEVRRLASDVINTTQYERERISRVLHDDLQQRMYAIQMRLSFLRDVLPDENEAARKEITETGNELAEIVKIMRSLSIDLSPPILPDEGLAHAVEWLAHRMQEQYGFPVELQANGSFVMPNKELHVLLFNCIRELLFNVVKHAGASRAVVALAWSDPGLQIQVRDDGKGFPTLPSEVGLRQDGYPRSLGLPSIRHQLSMFGGRMEIQSTSGAGTQVTLIVPQAETES